MNVKGDISFMDQFSRLLNHVGESCRSRIALNVTYQKSASDQMRPTPRVSHRVRWVVGMLCLGALLIAGSALPVLAVPQSAMNAPAMADSNARAHAVVNSSINLEVAPGCLNLVEGGDFEQFNPSWQIVASARPPMYSNEQTFNSSAQSLRVGNGFELPNIESVSEVRHKPILLPIGATRIILRFLYFPIFEPSPGADLQQADLFDATNDQLIGTLLNAQDDARSWKARDFDLTAYAGRSVSLRFRVRNDGGVGRTLMYVDNIELEYCAPGPLPTLTPTSPPLPSATPSATGIATLTPTPILTPVFTPVTVVPTVVVPPEDLNCPNILVNGTFEGFDGWDFGEDPVPPRYINNFFQEGSRAVLLGNPPENPTNVVTFSSIRQLVTIPFTTGQIQLRWWRLLKTAQVGAPSATTDRQDLILLSPSLQPIQILRRELRNDGIWQEDVVDLTNYRGQTLYIYFNAFNDANNTRTWMYVDNVRLRACGIQASGASVSAEIGATPIAIPLTPIATYTTAPLPTPSPWPSLTATETLLPLLSPLITEGVSAALAPMPVVTELPTLLAAPTNNVYALPTLPTQTVIGSPSALPEVLPTTPPAAIATPIAVVSVQPVWRERLGAIAVLVSILVLISFIVFAIVRMFRRPD